MNSDARLEFGLETPLLHESDAPDAADLLQSAKDQLCSILDIENDEEWQVCSNIYLAMLLTLGYAAESWSEAPPCQICRLLCEAAVMDCSQ